MLPVILHIETSTEICSVALSRGENLLAVRENSEGLNHATLLTSFIEEMLREHSVLPKHLDAIAVSIGPGSYTGLRIGLSTAKGLCYGNDIRLIAISTLQAMSFGFMQLHPIAKNELLCPMIDARRMEVYTALYNNDGQQVEAITAKIITEDSFIEQLERHRIHFFGNGASKCELTLAHPHAVFDRGYVHSASCFIKLALQAYHSNNFEDVAYCEPFYLKDFLAGKSKS